MKSVIEPANTPKLWGRALNVGRGHLERHAGDYVEGDRGRGKRLRVGHRQRRQDRPRTLTANYQDHPQTIE